MAKPLGRGGPHRRHEAQEILIFGLHAASAALANPARTVGKLYLTDNAARHLSPVLAARSLIHERVLPRELDHRLGPDTVHQGVLMETQPLPDAELGALVTGGGRPLVALDQVTDPHNVGAVLRSAAAFGAAGLVMTRRHSPPLGGVLAKAASGALEHVPIARVPNLARALAELKSLACALIGLTGDAPDSLETLAWPERPVLVLGAEGRGLRVSTRAACDHVCRIATEGAVQSLNVSNAAAVALHLASLNRRQRRV